METELQEIDIFETFDDVVVEMTTDPAAMVALSPDIVARVTEGDADPRFATFVIESGWSKSKRFWGPELFTEVAAEMNRAAGHDPIVGYMGHIRPEDDPYSFPEIQLQWLGAKLTHSGDKAKLAVKAYVLPNTKGSDYLKRGLVKTVSWRGKVAQELFQGGVKVKKFAIESIDLSRPRSAGMSARLVGALTSEMETEGGLNVKPDEILALQENELRAHNPGLVTAIETAVRSPLESQISEMTAEATAVKPVVSLIPDFKKLLGLADDTDDLNTVQAVISHLRSQGKSLRDSVLTSVLDRRLKGGEEKDRKLVHSLIASEMRDQEVHLTGDTEKDEKIVSEMVNSIIDSREELKEIVSEMEEAAPSLPSGLGDRGKPREIKAGLKTASIRVRSATR